MELFKTTIKSKYYKQPSRKRFALILVANIGIAVFVLISLFTALMEGFHGADLGRLFLAVVLVGLINQRPENKERYEFCLLDLILREDRMQIAQDNGYTYEFMYTDIQEMQFSDQLMCLRLFGRYSEGSKYKAPGKTKFGEKLLYLEKEGSATLLAHVGRISNRGIHYVDRK
ncbi:MAG: hypothetical protein FWF88_12015 [Peptococcaceae bacterium]|nr:hypothetical protein [Peptococcaceae bacterium]